MGVGDVGSNRLRFSTELLNLPLGFSESRASKPICAPRAANSRVMARPTPLEAPVMTTVSPCSLMIFHSAGPERQYLPTDAAFNQLVAVGLSVPPRFSALRVLLRRL